MELERNEVVRDSAGRSPSRAEEKISRPAHEKMQNKLQEPEDVPSKLRSYVISLEVE